MIDFILGFGVAALLAGLYIHLVHGAPKPAAAPAPAPTLDLTALKGLIASEVAKVPALVSSTVSGLENDLSAALQRAEAAEATQKAQEAAHAAQLAQVAQRVTAVIQASPELA